MKKIVFLLLIFQIMIYSVEKRKDLYEGYWFMPNNKVIIEIQEKNGEYMILGMENYIMGQLK